MKNKKIYGLFFMAIAVFIVIAQLNIAAFQSSSLVIWTVVFGYFLIKGLLKMSWFMISLSAFLIINMYNNIYHFLPFSPMVLLIVLGVFFLGFAMVFKKTPSVEIRVLKKSDKNYQQNVMSSVTKYIDDKEIEQFTYEAKLSDTTFYFDNADLKHDTATFDFTVKLSSVTIYVPRHWRVVNEMKVVLGEANQQGIDYPTTKTVYLKGKVALGELKIIYV